LVGLAVQTKPTKPRMNAAVASIGPFGFHYVASVIVMISCGIWCRGKTYVVAELEKLSIKNPCPLVAGAGVPPSPE